MNYSPAATVAILLTLLAAPAPAQRGGSGGGKGAGSSSQQNDDSDDIAVPVCPQVAGQHPLLENLTRELRLSCPQEIRILSLMHDEETVSKPLLAYAALTPEERQAILLKVELAARIQIRPFLQPEQQRKNDEGAAAAARAPKRTSRKKAQPIYPDAFANEEALSTALDLYSALTVAQKKEMILQVKRAARREGAPLLTPEQAAKIDADITSLHQ